MDNRVEVSVNIYNRWFERFIITLILLNSVILGIYDYNDRDNKTSHNKTI